MPVCSYILYPEQGKFSQLKKKLSDFCRFEIHSDDAKQLLILVTDTKTHEEERALQKELADIEEVQCLTLAFAANDEGEL